jgi:hypothetical protein
MDISENVMAETTPERGNELKAILFKFLLEEYAHQNEYLITLLELFLVHFYHSNDDMKDFIQVLIKEATGHLEGKLLEDEKLDWYFSMTNNQKKFYRLETRARYFKNLSKSINQLYDLIRNSLTLQSDQFLHVQYSYLPLNRDNYEIIRQFATSVKREDYFLIGLVSLAYQKASDRGYTFSMLIDTLSESVGAHLVKDKKDQKTEHHLMLKYIEERLKSKTRDITNCNSSVTLVKTFDTFGRKMKQLILNILKEYHAQDNPFRCSSIITTHSAVRLSVTELASDISLEKLCIKETENTLLTDNFQVDIHSTTSPTASSTAPIARSEDGAARKKRLEEKLKALLGLGSTRPQEPMKPILQDFLPMTAGSIKFSSEPKAAGSSTSTKQIMQRPEEPLKAILANLCKGQQFSFSKREAVLFFRSKELQFNSVVDCVVGNKGVREYSAEGDENNILAAGVLTCLLHAIRLLFVDRVLDASNGQYGRYQELLTIMVSKMKSWKVAEVIKGLKLDSSLAEMHCFESFIKKFCEVHRGLFTVLPTIQWSSFLDLKSQQSIVQDLYLKGIQRSKDPMNCIFFLSISGTPPPSTQSIPLPYLFHCRTMPSGEVDPDSATLQLVGLIYCCAKGEYSFSFITYARCRKYGQYEVFIKKQAEDVFPSHFVPYAHVNRVTGKATYPPPCPVFARDSEKRPLVGIILVRNDMQSDADPRFLAQPIIREINGSNITSSMMRSLDDPGAWLVDELVHGPIYLMFDHLSKSSPGFAHGNKMYICNSWTFEKHINGGYNISPTLQANFKDCDFNLYIINLGNSHWLCACAPMNASLPSKEKKIYFLDSMNDTATATQQGQLLVKFFKDKLQLPGYKPVLLPSSSQNNDGCTCGLFTILNATLILKSISQGSFDPNELQRRTPRLFDFKEKFEMRQSVQRILHGTEDVSSFLSWV